MVCDDVRRVAYFFLDGTLGDSKRAAFENHLDLCDDCETRVRFHDRMRGFLRRRLNRVAAPAAFRERLGASLEGLRVSG